MADAEDPTPGYGGVMSRTLSFLDKLLSDFWGTLSLRQPVPDLQTTQDHPPKPGLRQPQTWRGTKTVRKWRRRPGRRSMEGGKRRPASARGAYRAGSWKIKQDKPGRGEQGISKKKPYNMDSVSILSGSICLLIHPITWYCTLPMTGIG
ncbi:Hypothetical predicted protein [Pelobates cultripes]|uniref:Uncharacterized protein n=1 Tax=Pelobates cultripes TaxID=61616 RepID=A0AAD1S5V5_PELCU|nr:Hypothetical predicted protein [Pelobates cultripes]